VVKALPRRDPKIRTPVAYIKDLRLKYSHPRDAGITWFDEEWTTVERRALKARILQHKGESFHDGKGSAWLVDPHGDGVITPEGRVQIFGGLRIEDMRRIAARLEARAVAEEPRP
jgi:hypothetical protein